MRATQQHVPLHAPTRASFPTWHRQVDTFSITCPHLGDLVRLDVKSDGSGLGAAWHLDHVEVTCSQNSDHVVMFPCGQWLDKNVGLDKRLKPGSLGDGRCSGWLFCCFGEWQV